MSLNWWAIGEGTTARSRQSRVTTRHNTGRGHRGWNPPPAGWDLGAEWPDGRKVANLLPEHLGHWVHYVWGFRVSSAKEANDGFIRGFVNGELVFDVTHDGGADNPAQNGVDRGYIMGHHNPGFVDTTDFYLADWRVGTAPHAIGLTLEHPGRGRFRSRGRLSITGYQPAND
jgi:hypothetical protein